MDELDEIRRDYQAGRLEAIRQDLERFILAHRARIDEFRRRQEARGLPALSDELAIKFYIIRHRSINPAREIQDQLHEIEREKWIRGVSGGCEPDPQAVALDWARRHSAGWRAHRVTIIVFVFDQDKARFCRILRGEECPQA